VETPLDPRRLVGKLRGGKLLADSWTLICYYPPLMKILVIGSGGREHAIVDALARSPQKPELYATGENAGIAAVARSVPGCADTDSDALLAFAKKEAIDLLVVGPEAPLVLGIADRFEAEGFRVFGPRKAAAQLEGSKIYTKEFLRRHEIPTADFHIFDEAPAAAHYLETATFPIVLKADGLAAGKGVIVARNRAEALVAVEAILVERRFGDAGNRLLIEDFLTGSELSLLVITDGESCLPLETAQDYKPALDGDRGLNTGGMGCYSPYYELDHPVVTEAMNRIVHPTLRGLSQEGVPFQGVLYVGIMLTKAGPLVLEFNVRFGDPETQAILSRLGTDLVEVFERTVQGRLAGLTPQWDARHCVCVVAASPGYPGKYPSGLVLSGLSASGGVEGSDVRVYHAGTKRGPQGEFMTAGGRVLGVTALGDSREAARTNAYEALRKIHFEGMHYRTDIGAAGR
jgi:phosphoribosylamine--glycine ligase